MAAPNPSNLKLTTEEVEQLVGSWSPGAYLSAREKQLHELQREVYEERAHKFGIAREQARKDLPLSTYTEAYWKIDLHNLLHFLPLRMDSHAQKEVRDFATTIGEKIVKPLLPMAWEAFEDYRLNALYLTGLDTVVINNLMSYVGKTAPFSQEDFMNHQHESWAGLKRCRERDECLYKLVRLGIVSV